MPIIDVVMPKLGESVTEGRLVRWLVRPGDTVEAYAPLCEVETDKVTAEVPSTAAGTVEAILVAEGDVVAVGTPIARLRVREAEASAALPSAAPAGAAGSGAPPADGAAPARVGQGAVPTASVPAIGATEARDGRGAAPPASGRSERGGGSLRGRYSPAVRRLLAEHGLDPAAVPGTGAHGRVTRKDVLAYLKRRADATPATVESPVHGPTASVHPPHEAARAPFDGDVVLPITAVRRRIAERMVESKRTAPHAWMMVEVDATRLVRYRKAVMGAFETREGFRLTYLPFFLRAVTLALREHPRLNASWTDEGIVLRKDIHLSIAVAHDDALYVPVIPHADALSVVGLARALHDLVERTRAGRLRPDDVAGGTFTVNNTGAFGSVLSMPIINPPQAAILSIEAIVKRPVVVDEGTIAIRDMVNLTLSLDHRVMDGAAAGAFLQTVKRLIETFDEATFAV
ncbi:MAG: Dihydrolipoamide acyltransferase component of branched-chain alpha-keto acid dehydrogenase complex [Hydrogenibacillus schlegelii]|uniref:Dihydrolipoamide acetyltransferase component of pyruvate dehydrogenase complex n=1 Tax=Hydrogenibacillus schlegelii TaxID=1484 RepID=A0A2T5GC56_HYDSH|nr:dihydrolipoamide acetyltransferase family protein [Hydrogenibacillus schlegelii]PTQ53718.1 MAG: Dihydrolipoamide acyltransferase component of branched-chain alpha-keto acid dehydrogenase complex [Hydrogenibacillus schlegelii]